jgi:D-serine deaminase-like pyridoxal phosphate-dependent protein
MQTRRLLEDAGLLVEVVAGGSTGTYDIDSELDGLTELQSGSYCVMDLDYRRIGGRVSETFVDFEMALTVVTTVVSVPTADRAMVDGGLRRFPRIGRFHPRAWSARGSSTGSPETSTDA